LWVGPNPLAPTRHRRCYPEAVSLLVLAGIAGGIAAASMFAAGVRWAVRRRPAPLPFSDTTEPDAASAPEPLHQPSFEAFGLSLGDVIMLRDSEAWLTGALVLKDAGEDEVGLFFTDQTVEGDVLLVRPSPRRLLWLVRAVDVPDAALAPHSLEHERELFTRTRRIPVTIEQVGDGCPPVGDSAMWAWFESAGGDLLVCLHCGQGAFAWRGREVDEGSTLRLAAGKATFRE